MGWRDHSASRLPFLFLTSIIRHLSYSSSKGRSASHPLQQVTHFLECLNQHTSPPSLATLVSMLRLCGSHKLLDQGRMIHAHITNTGIAAHMFIANNLIWMYSNCSSILDARHVFDTMPIRNVVSWNAMIGGYSKQANNQQQAFKLLQLMQQNSVQPDKVTFLHLLKACAKTEAFAPGKLIHAQIIHQGLESDILLGTTLIHMYGTCNSFEDASAMFDRMPERTEVTWNAMISGYIHNGFGNSALFLFFQMEQEIGVKPNETTCTIILNICASPEFLAMGKLIHAYIVDKEFGSEALLGHALVNMYRKCGSVEDAHRLFNSMPERSVATWNALIAAYIEHGQREEAVKLFQKMQREGLELDEVTFTSILNVYEKPEALTAGKVINAHIIDAGFDSNITIRNALITMYGKCSSINDACRTFDNMVKKDLISWNAIIAVYTQHGYGAEASNTFQEMQQEGMEPDKVTFISILNACEKPYDLALGRLIHGQVINRGIPFDVVLETALLNMYGKCGNVKDAYKIFDRMAVRNVVSWSAMITICCRSGCAVEAFDLFVQMQQEGIKPDKISFINILNACGSPEVLALGKLVHTHIVEARFEADIAVGNALVNMYGKCGGIEDACAMFDKILRPDVISWNALIAAYAQHGYGKETLEMFQKMQSKGEKADMVTFISVLNVCSHAGFVDEGLLYFCSMIHDFDIRPTIEHFNCVVHLLSRATRLDEAEELINNMPFQPNTVVWTSLLGSCSVNESFDRGERAGEQALELEPQSASLHVAISNLYAAAGRWDNVGKVRKLMADKSVTVKKNGGQRWIVFDNIVHEFTARDKSHPQTEEMLAELREYTSAAAGSRV